MKRVGGNVVISRVQQLLFSFFLYICLLKHITSHSIDLVQLAVWSSFFLLNRHTDIQERKKHTKLKNPPTLPSQVGPPFSINVSNQSKYLYATVQLVLVL